MGCRLGLNSILNMLISVIIILIRNSWRSRRESSPPLFNISTHLMCLTVSFSLLVEFGWTWQYFWDRFVFLFVFCTTSMRAWPVGHSWRWRRSLRDVYVLKTCLSHLTHLVLVATLIRVCGCYDFLHALLALCRLPRALLKRNTVCT